jgi:hypothetical protein
MKRTEKSAGPLCGSVAEIEGNLVSGNEPPFQRINCPNCQTFEIADDVEASLKRNPAMKARVKFVAAASRREAREGGRLRILDEVDFRQIANTQEALQLKARN